MVGDWIKMRVWIARDPQVSGRRLTYRVLCAIGDAGFMGIQ